MVPVADEEAQLEKLEWLEGVEDGVDEPWIDVFELGDLGSVVDDFLWVCVTDSDEGLIAFELFEKFLNWGVDNRHDIHYLPHDFVLDVDVAPCFDDFGIEGESFFQILHDGVFWVQFMRYFWDGISDPEVIGVD